MKLSTIGWSWLVGVAATLLLAQRFWPEGDLGVSSGDDSLEMQTEKLVITITAGFVVVVMSMGAALAVWWTEREAGTPEEDER